MSEERIHYEGHIKDVEGQFVQLIPATLKCRTCGRPVMKAKKDQKRKHMSLEIVTTVPPKVMHDGAVMCLICDKCGARTLVRMRA